jgi:hypothetical protein
MFNWIVALLDHFFDLFIVAPSIFSHCPNVCFGIGKEEKPMKVEQKNNSYLQNMFLFVLLFGPLLLSKLITLSFLIHF